MASGRMLRKQISISEQVNELSLKAAFLFTWMIPHVDDFGRMLGSPKKVKAMVVPLKEEITSSDVESSLQEMQEKGLIYRYKVNGELYLQLIKFEEHQQGLHKRTKSLFPSPEEQDISGKFPEVPGNSHPRTKNLELGTKNKDLNTNNLSVVSGSQAESLEEPETENFEKVKKTSTDDCPHQAIIELYQEILPTAVRVRSWDGQRRVMLRQRWRENPDHQNLDWWRKFFEYIAESDFLMGKIFDPARGPMKLKLHWIVKPANFDKILDGDYENR